MTIAENVALVRERIERAANGRFVQLVAVSKTKPPEDIRQAVAVGVSCLGENYVQELCRKSEQGAYTGAAVHMIGHLQRNKVKQVVGRVELIQSVDSEALLRAISGAAEGMNRIQDVLIEINAAGEATKTGAAPERLESLLETAAELSHVRVRGLMTIPPVNGGKDYFSYMYKLFVDIRGKKYDNVSMDFLSMGMSADFEEAISEGSNMVRVGSAIFGERRYGTGNESNGG